MILYAVVRSTYSIIIYFSHQSSVVQYGIRSTVRGDVETVKLMINDKIIDTTEVKHEKAGETESSVCVRSFVCVCVTTQGNLRAFL